MGRKLPKNGSIPSLQSYPCRTGTAVVGSAVSAATDDGSVVVEGNVEYLLPWGAEWFDPEWRDCTVVIIDHETGKRSNWDPRNVDVLDSEYGPSEYFGPKDCDD